MRRTTASCICLIRSPTLPQLARISYELSLLSCGLAKFCVLLATVSVITQQKLRAANLNGSPARQLCFSLNLGL